MNTKRKNKNGKHKKLECFEKNAAKDVPENAGTPKHAGGRKSAWETHILPNMEKIIDFYAKGATQEKIRLWLGVSATAWFNALRGNEKFRNALTRARMGILHEVRGALISAALGGERKITSIKEVDGKKIKYIQKVNAEPNVPACLAILKNSGDWSDNPVVDNAVASEAESKKNYRERVLASLGVPVDAKPRSVPADALGEDAEKNIVRDEELPSFGA